MNNIVFNIEYINKLMVSIFNNKTIWIYEPIKVVVTIQ